MLRFSLRKCFHHRSLISIGNRYFERYQHEDLNHKHLQLNTENPSGNNVKLVENINVEELLDLSPPKPFDEIPVKEEKGEYHPAEFIDSIGPPLPVSFNLAAYVNHSETLIKLVQLGVDLSQMDKDPKKAKYVLKLDFEKDIKSHIQFLHDHGVASDELGNFITKNPYIFQEDLENLQIRINYLKSKKFSSDAIAWIITRNPFFLNKSTKAIDKYLGILQKQFSLTGDEVRSIITRCSKLVNQDNRKFQEIMFTSKEVCGFTFQESKQLLVLKPKVFTLGAITFKERFDIAHNVMGIPHERIVEFPGVLLIRGYKLRERHEYLVFLNRAQYDPKKPNFISLQDIAATTDQAFCEKCAKTSVEQFNEFLKTRSLNNNICNFNICHQRSHLSSWHLFRSSTNCTVSEKGNSPLKKHWDHFVFVEEDCIVGRKDSTLLIANDPSVSRKHAVLTLKHSEENLGFPTRKSSLFLRDEGSKYGTFKNGVRITSEEELSDGDIIKFGQFESEFKIHYQPLVVTTSCLDVASKNKLKNVIHKLGGHLVSEWQPSCTHLVMSLVKVTIKALCCLVSLKSIVLPEYFEELYKKLKSTASVLSPTQYIPPIGESLIDKDAVSFDVDPQRKSLFKDKTFYFIDDKQFKKLHLGIIMGGGNASILSEGKVDPDSLSNDNSCFIEPAKGQLVKEESKELYKEILNSLQKKNLRMIPESDIGLAVVYASTEKFCNPSFNVGSAVLGSQKISSQTLTEREVYVPDTQESVKRSKPSIKDFLSSTSNSEPKSKKQKTEAPDSLNLTSFRDEDAGEVFEIPLSAQVKQELDDIFDITGKDGNEDIQEDEADDVLPATLPSNAPPEPQFKMKKVEITEDKKDVPKSTSPRKSKKEKNTGLVNGNGFTSFDIKNEEYDLENLPRNLATVKVVSLIVRKPVLSSEQQHINSSVKNFKRFKKVLPLKAQALPVIIGGSDLVPYDKNAAKLAEQDWDDEPEVVHNGKIKGAFDWDSQNT